jgi:hypothetical protein
LRKKTETDPEPLISLRLDKVQLFNMCTIKETIYKCAHCKAEADRVGPSVINCEKNPTGRAERCVTFRLHKVEAKSKLYCERKECQSVKEKKDGEKKNGGK